MKLSMINESMITELFDGVSMDGVQFDRDGGLYSYYFEDESGNPYTVVFEDVGYTHKDFEILADLDHNPFRHHPIAVYELVLGAGESKTKPTGRGNFGFVYSKLLAITKHFIDTVEPDGLFFEGDTPGMDAVYAKMIKRFQKSSDPSYRFRHVGMNVFFSDHFLDAVRDDTPLDNELSKYDQEHAEHLERRKAMAKVEREARLNG